MNNDSFSEVDLTNYEATVYIKHKQEYYQLADFLHDSDVLALRENDEITITCPSGKKVRFKVYQCSRYL